MAPKSKMNTYEQTNSVNYRHFIKGHRAKHKSKTKPPKSLPLPSVFSLLLKNGSFIMLSFPTTHFSQTPRLHWFFFFFHSDKTALASPALGELQSQRSPRPLIDSHFCVSLSDESFLLLMPPVWTTYSLLLLQALHIDFCFLQQFLLHSKFYERYF